MVYFIYSSPDNHPPTAELSSCFAEEGRLRAAPQKHILVGAASFGIFVDEKKMISDVRKVTCPKLCLQANGVRFYKKRVQMRKFEWRGFRQ